MHVNDIAKQLPFTIEPHEIEYLSLIGEYKKSPIEEIRFLEKFLVNMEGCA